MAVYFVHGKKSISVYCLWLNHVRSCGKIFKTLIGRRREREEKERKMEKKGGGKGKQEVRIITFKHELK